MDASPRDPQALRLRAEQALRGVVDPELGINVVDLGLVYGLDLDGATLRIRLTMTSPGCPLGSYLAEAAEAAVREALPELEAVQVRLVFDPPWGPERMSEAARRQLQLDPGDGGSGWFSV
jgi:metal-sulfur cluster biosynthetic enzyme